MAKPEYQGECQGKCDEKRKAEKDTLLGYPLLRAGCELKVRERDTPSSIINVVNFVVFQMDFDENMSEKKKKTCRNFTKLQQNVVRFCHSETNN